MRLSTSYRLTLTAMALAGFFGSDVLRAADPAKLAQVLGRGGADGWTITPAAYTVSAEPALAASSAAGVTLKSKAGQAAPGEYFFAFRLKPAKGGSAHVNLQMACGVRPDKTPQSLSFSVARTSELTSVNYAASV